MKIKSSKIFKIIAIALCFFMFFEQSGFAQVAGQLDISGSIAAFRNSIILDKFRPLHLRYLQFDSQANNFNLLLDKGNSKTLSKPFVETSTQTLLNYFFIGVTLPNDSFWVNLRPDSPDNVIDPLLAQTDIGKILLEADVQLKKDTAKFTSPETPEGKEYWDKLYEKAGAIFGSQNVTIPTLTRPWIVPNEIILRETADNAYIYKATLKVMLEEDYLKGSAVYNFSDPRLKELNTYASHVLREKIIPKLTQEINTSKRYASLRQVYYSLILAQWFKQRFKSGDGSLKKENRPLDSNPYISLIDRKNLTGLTSKESWSKNTYFQQYQKSFKDGEYNFKVPMTTPYGQVIRSYFSGGILAKITIPALGTNTTSEQGGSVTSIIGNKLRNIAFNIKSLLGVRINSNGQAEVDDGVIHPAITLESKKPWQMTLDAYHNMLVNQEIAEENELRVEILGLEEKRNSMRKLQPLDEKAINEIEAKLKIKQRILYATMDDSRLSKNTGSRWGHSQAIEKALVEGKAVPKEVLAEYPELSPQGLGTVKKTMEVYSAMVVHGVNIISDNANNLSTEGKGLNWKDRLRFVMEHKNYKFSCSTIKDGDSNKAFFAPISHPIGFILKDGIIVAAHSGDASSVALNGQRVFWDGPGDIDGAINKRRHDGYNELSVKNIEIFGLYINNPEFLEASIEGTGIPKNVEEIYDFAEAEGLPLFFFRNGQLERIYKSNAEPHNLKTVNMSIVDLGNSLSMGESLKTIVQKQSPATAQLLPSTTEGALSAEETEAFLLDKQKKGVKVVKGIKGWKGKPIPIEEAIIEAEKGKIIIVVEGDDFGFMPSMAGGSQEADTTEPSIVSPAISPGLVLIRFEKMLRKNNNMIPGLDKMTSFQKNPVKIKSNLLNGLDWYLFEMPSDANNNFRYLDVFVRDGQVIGYGILTLMPENAVLRFNSFEKNVGQAESWAGVYRERVDMLRDIIGNRRIVIPPDSVISEEQIAKRIQAYFKFKGKPLNREILGNIISKIRYGVALNADEIAMATFSNFNGYSSFGPAAVFYVRNLGLPVQPASQRKIIFTKEDKKILERLRTYDSAIHDPVSEEEIISLFSGRGLEFIVGNGAEPATVSPPSNLTAQEIDKNLAVPTVTSAEVDAAVREAIETGGAVGIKFGQNMTVAGIDSLFSQSNSLIVSGLMSLFDGLPDAAKANAAAKLEQYLARSPTNKETLKQALQYLLQQINSSPDKEPLLNKRFVIILDENNIFADGDVLAHAGEGRESIYLHINSLNFVQRSPYQEAADDFQAVLEHENWHIDGNLGRKYRDKDKNGHYYQSEEQKTRSDRFWEGSRPGIGRSSNTTTFGLELELRIGNQLGHSSEKLDDAKKQGNNIEEKERWLARREGVRKAIEDALPAGWVMKGQGPNIFEILTPPIYNTKAEWAKLLLELERIQNVVPGGFYSAHMHIGRPTKDQFNSEMDQARFARIAKVYEAMWRALAGYGYREPRSSNLTTFKDKKFNDMESAIKNHLSIINLSYHMPTSEIKIITGLLDGDFNWLDLSELSANLWWVFALFSMSTEAIENMPLAILGLPVVAGAKPTSKQINRFLDVVFPEGKDPQGRQIARQRFDELRAKGEDAGLPADQIEAIDKAIAADYDSLGLKVVYSLHKANEGYNENLLENLRANDGLLLQKLAEDFIARKVGNNTAKGYFPIEIHEELEQAMNTAQAAKRVTLTDNSVFDKGSIREYLTAANIEHMAYRIDRNFLINFGRGVREANIINNLEMITAQSFDRSLFNSSRINNIRFQPDLFRGILNENYKPEIRVEKNRGASLKRILSVIAAFLNSRIARIFNPIVNRLEQMSFNIIMHIINALETRRLAKLGKTANEQLRAVDVIFQKGEKITIKNVNVLIAALLRAEDPRVKIKVAEFLGEMRLEMAVRALNLVLAADLNVRVRVAAAQALGKIGGVGAVNALEQLVSEDNHPWAKDIGIIALGNIGSLEAVNALERIGKNTKEEWIKNQIDEMIHNNIFEIKDSMGGQFIARSMNSLSARIWDRYIDALYRFRLGVIRDREASASEGSNQNYTFSGTMQQALKDKGDIDIDELFYYSQSQGIVVNEEMLGIYVEAYNKIKGQNITVEAMRARIMAHEQVHAWLGSLFPEEKQAILGSIEAKISEADKQKFQDRYGVNYDAEELLAKYITYLHMKNNETANNYFGSELPSFIEGLGSSAIQALASAASILQPPTAAQVKDKNKASARVETTEIDVAVREATVGLSDKKDAKIFADEPFKIEFEKSSFDTEKNIEIKKLEDSGNFPAAKKLREFLEYPESKIIGILRNKDFVEKSVKEIFENELNFSIEDIKSISVKRIGWGQHNQVFVITIVRKGGANIQFVLKVSWLEGIEVFEKSVETLRELNRDKKASNFVPRIGASHEDGELKVWSEEYVNTNGKDLRGWRDELTNSNDKEKLRAIEKEAIRTYYLLYKATRGGYIDDSGPGNVVIREDNQGRLYGKVIDIGRYRRAAADPLIKDWLEPFFTAGYDFDLRLIIAVILEEGGREAAHQATEEAAKSILEKHGIRSGLDSYETQKAVYGDKKKAITLLEHAILLDAFWGMNRNKKQLELESKDINEKIPELPEGLKQKIIRNLSNIENFEILARFNGLSIMISIGALAKVLENAGEALTFEEKRILWRIAHLVTREEYVKRSIEDVDGHLAVFKALDEKLAHNDGDVGRIKVLDLGSGSEGAAISELTKDDRYKDKIEAYGLDMSVVDNVKETAQNEGVVLKEGDISDSQFEVFPENTFDFIYSTAVMGYLSDAEFVRAAKNIIRILRPGGVFIFNVVNGEKVRDYFEGIEVDVKLEEHGTRVIVTKRIKTAETFGITTPAAAQEVKKAPVGTGISTGEKVLELTAEEVSLLIKKYGPKLFDGTYNDNTMARISPTGNFINQVSYGEKDKIIFEKGAIYCNYIILYDTENKKAIVVHTNNSKDKSFAQGVINKFGNRSQFNFQDNKQNIVVLIVRRNDSSSALINESEQIEALYRGIIDSKGISRLATDVNEAWGLVGVRFLVEEGVFLALSRDGKSVTRAIKIQKETKVPQYGANDLAKDPSGMRPSGSITKTGDKGGIDFRGLPITTQPINSMVFQKQSLSETVPSVRILSSIVPDKEWQQIENMVNAGIRPSLERIREYLVLSCKDADCQAKIERALSGIADILRLEEEHSSLTDKGLKEILVLLESNKTAEQLSMALAKIIIAPQEPIRI